MASSSDEKKLLLLLHDHPPKHRKGGCRTIPFIILNEAFERLASVGLTPNMVFYLMNEYHMELVPASIILSLWSSLSNGLAIFGALLADSYLGRFRVIALGSIFSLLGMIMLWLTAMIPQLKPATCDQFNNGCNSPTITQVTVLFTSFGLMSIGAGCIRPCSLAFGLDQLDNKQNPNNQRVLESYINWYYTSIAFASFVALTAIVYTQDHLGWKVGFVIPALLMVFSALVFFMGSFLYIKVKASKSLLVGFVQVLAVAFKRRNVSLPPTLCDDCYHQSHEAKLLAPTENLRCLNKACIITNPDSDLNPDGSASDPWNLCTVEQVESLKSFLRVLPMWSTGIMLQVIVQNTFATVQAKTMDRHIISSFEIPAGSISLFLVVMLIMTYGIYECVMVPLIARYTGRRCGLSPKVRMGTSLVLSCIGMATSAITESIRRGIAIEEGLEDNPDASVQMSVMWLVPSFMFLGAAEAFASSGQLEFYHTQFPKSMGSIAVALYTLGMAISSLVGSLLVDVLDNVTGGGGKISWLSSNLNKGHIDYYYWLLAFLSVVNYVYFLVCCRAYGPGKDERAAAFSDEVDEGESHH